MTGTPSRTARVPAARQDLKEAAGKVPARGTRIAYEAIDSWARGPKYPKPESHPERSVVYAAGIWDEGHAPYPGRSGLLPETASVVVRRRVGSQKSAETIVVAGAPRRRVEREWPSRCGAFDGCWRRRHEG
jgi:hypothetical protein